MGTEILKNSPLRKLNDTLRRLSNDQVAGGVARVNPSVQVEIENVRASLRYAVDTYRYASVGLAGVFGTEKCQSIATLLASSIVRGEGVTATVARVTRDDVHMRSEREPDDMSWQSTIVPQRLNQWPERPVSADREYHVDDLELLQWLRVNSEFSLLTFDNLGDVVDRLPMARRLDGLIIVNSGRQFDRELMNKASAILQAEGVRVLGQIRNFDDCG